MQNLRIDINSIIPANGINAYFQNGSALYYKKVAVWALCPGNKIYGLIPGKDGLSVAELHPGFGGYVDL